MNTILLPQHLSSPPKPGAELTGDAVCLQPKQILKLRKRTGGLQLTCLDGNVWITQPGDPHDHLLHANESINLTGKGVVLVQALPEALIRWQ